VPSKTGLFVLIAGQKNRSPEQETALAALLLRDQRSGPRRPSRGERSDDDHNPDPDLAGYKDSLVGTVMEIADREPQRSDVWPELLARASYNGSSVMMALFASSIQGVGRVNALVGLAKIISYERDEAEKQISSSADLQILDRTIRERLSDSDVEVRMQALTAAGIMGSAGDLQMLDRVAATDPYHDSGIDLYPCRVAARATSQRLRRRLAAQASAKR
jgi:hypothetical protein